MVMSSCMTPTTFLPCALNDRATASDPRRPTSSAAYPAKTTVRLGFHPSLSAMRATSVMVAMPEASSSAPGARIASPVP